MGRARSHPPSEAVLGGPGRCLYGAAVDPGLRAGVLPQDPVAEGTVRQQPQEFMARAGVRRHAEVVRALLSGVAQLRVERGI